MLNLPRWQVISIIAVTLLAALFALALLIVPFAKVPPLTNDAPVEAH